MRTEYQVAREMQGREVFVNEWAAEKLMVVGIEHPRMRGWVGSPIGDDEDLYSAYRNVAKIAGWMGGDTTRYSEDRVERAFLAGERAMREELELLFGLDVDVVDHDVDHETGRTAHG